MKTNDKDCMIPIINELHNISRDEKGFSLIELVAVVAIIGILATIGLNGIYEFREKARESVAAGEIRGLEKDIIAYAAERGEYPATLADVNQAGETDPWGNPYEYTRNPARTFAGDKINTDFDIYSKGKDGISPDPSIALPGCTDDIVRGNDGGYTGTAHLYGI